MARMIPPQYDNSTSSSAEKRLFNLFKNDPDTESWIILHSLGLSRRSKKPYGEIDFVVLVPEGGMVCLEVKGGRITCADGIWHTTDRHGKKHQMKRSPFMQAREGMFALREELGKKFSPGHQASGCITGYAAVFPDVLSPPRTPEFEPWESIDQDSLRHPISKTIKNLLRNQRRKLGANKSPEFTPRAVREICQFLRPDFEVVVARSTLVSRTEEKLLRLTEEQYDVLDRLAENKRCLIKGPAGTGKTLLSLEHARRSSAAGIRTLFVCFNRVLGDWLATQTEGLPGVTCGSFHRCVRELILHSPHASEFEEQTGTHSEREIWNEIFPFYGELAGSESEDPFDMLIVDEAQDLLHSSAMNVLNTWLYGGLAGGNWIIGGDFTNQAIYSGNSEENAEELLESYCPHYTRERLTLNCRNTRQIAEETGFLSGFLSLPYRLGHVEGLAVDYRYWRNRDHQMKILAEVIEKLLDDGILPEDIVILSPRRFENSVASTVSKTKHISVRELRQGTGSKVSDEVAFSTIHSFKGMESKVVVMCDVEAVDSAEPQSLLYVGMSRARSHLTVLLSEGTRSHIKKMTARKLRNEWNR